MSVQDALFLQPFPLTWLLQDIIILLVSLLVLVQIIRYEKKPAITMLEAFAFVFLYAMIYENGAGVRGLYTFGRSIVMFGYVPATIPLIEVCVLLTGFWLLERVGVPDWTKPVIIGLFGMLQDFSLDPLAIRQVYTVGGVVSGRWNWLIGPNDVNILNVPVFNFPGWMLIMLYSATCLLVGRWIYRKSGHNAVVGYVYPFISMLAALFLMGGPLGISPFLLWLAPFLQKGASIEWVMLAVHLIVPTILLAVYLRQGAAQPFTKADLPIFLVPIVMHLSDIVFTLVGGYTEILWIVLLSSIVHVVILGSIFLGSQRTQTAKHSVFSTGQ